MIAAHLSALFQRGLVVGGELFVYGGLNLVRPFVFQTPNNHGGKSIRRRDLWPLTLAIHAFAEPSNGDLASSPFAVALVFNFNRAVDEGGLDTVVNDERQFFKRKKKCVFTHVQFRSSGLRMLICDSSHSPMIATMPIVTASSRI